MRPLETTRLLMRQWRETDRASWASMCADPEVMEFLSSDRDEATSNSIIDRWHERIEKQGWSFWAVEAREDGRFLGMAGLQVPAEPHPYLPCVEVGWRLARHEWGKGYASEAARLALRFAFEELGLREVIATTAKNNVRSSAVMQRVRMSGPEATFVHPGVPVSSALREHVLYRIKKHQFSAAGDAFQETHPK